MAFEPTSVHRFIDSRQRLLNCRTSLVHRRRMPEPTEPREVTNQQFNQPVQVDAVPAPPSLVLYQPCFPMSEADFLRLQQSDSLLAGLGGAGLTYGVSEGLPILGQLIRGTATLNITGPILLPLIAFLAGAVLLIWSVMNAKGKRTVMGKIRRHFAANPGALEIRQGEQR